MKWLKHPLVRIALAVVVVSSSLGGGTAHPAGDTPEGCVTPTKHLTLYAVQLPPAPDGSVRLAYGRTPETASIPGPTIELWEGDCLALTLVNDIPEATLAEMRKPPGDGKTPLGVSAHPHGVKYRPNSDGIPGNRWHEGSFVPPGQARTFVWYAAPLTTVGKRVGSLGSAGYWWYHDHIAGTTHGTGGVGAGLFGALIVRRAGDLTPDRTFVVGMGDNATLNLARSPGTDCESRDTPVGNRCMVAKPGERVEFVVVGMGSEHHTFHMHGHSWADTRTGALTGALDPARVIDNKSVGPADTFGFQVIAGESVGTGSWMLHCHVQPHSDAGMTTFFHVTPDGKPPLPVGSGHEHDHHGLVG
ncbi:MAG TPA: multicopper oxidase domain-containing protein [Actinomycetota bacterium]|nr:multicopper oxidase domain-containing protein [Actinomycetota bacterium]